MLSQVLAMQGLAMQDLAMQPSHAAVLFVDAGVSAPEELMQGAGSGVQVCLLDPHQDGIAQISTYLRRHPGYGAVHVVAHGEPGALRLGSGWLNGASLRRYGQQLRQWFAADGATAQLHLYGCRLGAGDRGRRLVQQLTQITGAWVYAAEGLVGATPSGPQWQLTSPAPHAPDPWIPFTPHLLATYGGHFNTPPTGVATGTLDAIDEDVRGVSIPPQTLLEGFSDGDGDTLRIAGITADVGTLTQTRRGLRYAPPADFNGLVTFTYTVTDGNGGAIVGVTRTLEVLPVNDAPTGTPTGTLAETAEDTAVAIDLSTLLEGISDVDGDSLSVVNLVADAGTVVDNLDGTLLYVPDPNFNGEVTFIYNVIDGNGGTLANLSQTLTVTPVNDVPTGSPTGDGPSTDEDVALTFDLSVLTAGIVDIDGDALTVVGLGASTGTLVTNGDGTATYTPPADFNGTVTLTYSVSDGNGGILPNLSQTLTVVPVNDNPTGSPTGTLADIDEDTATTFDASVLLAGFSDIDGDPLAVLGVSVSSGTLAVNEDGTYTYTPAANFNGEVTLTYSVIDGQGGKLSGATQTFTVLPINDAPTLTPPPAPISILENSPVGTLVYAPNAEDGDGDPLTYRLVSGNENGAFDLDPTTGEITVADPSLLDFEGAVGLPAFTLELAVSDGTGDDALTTTVTLDLAVADVNEHSDFNGDGVSDVLWRDLGTGLANVAYLGDGTLDNTAQLSPELASPNWQLEGTGDFDGDGREDDLVWRNYDTGSNLLVFTEAADGAQTTVSLLSLPSEDAAAGWLLQGVGDFDGDKLQDDLLWYRPETADVYVWVLDDGDPVDVINVSPDAAIDPAWEIGGVTSLDDDGLQDDILWRNTLTQEVAVWITEDGIATDFVLIDTLANPNWISVGVSDYDGDLNSDDILWFNTTNGNLRAWFMDGEVVASTSLLGTLSTDLVPVV